MWGKTIRGRRGVCEIPVRLRTNDGAMETVEYMCVDIWCMLGWIIGLCHKTAEIHFPCMCCSTSECINRDTVVADGDEVCENWNPLPDLTLEGPTSWNEDLCTQNRTENRCCRACERVKISGLMLATTRNTTGLLPQELSVTTTITRIIVVFKIIAIFLYIYTVWECRKFELQS